jgi:hypothetical protein
VPTRTLPAHRGIAAAPVPGSAPHGARGCTKRAPSSLASTSRSRTPAARSHGHSPALSYCRCTKGRCTKARWMIAQCGGCGQNRAARDGASDLAPIALAAALAEAASPAESTRRMQLSMIPAAPIRWTGSSSSSCVTAVASVRGQGAPG